MKRIYTALIGLALTVQPAMAQQDNTLPSRSMTIEGNYNASVSDAGKLMPVPERTEQNDASAAVEYVEESQPFGKFVRNPMAAPDRAATKSPYTGLIRFGYGMRGNIDLLGNAGLDVGEDGFLKINGSLNGWNTELETDWESKRYNADVGVTYTHRLPGMTIDATGGIGYDYLNFRNNPHSENYDDDLLSRNVMRGQIEAAVTSDRDDSFSYNVRAGWYMLTDDNISFDKSGKGTELIFRVSGNAGYKINTVYASGIELSAKYSSYDWLTHLPISKPYDSYFSVSARPHFDIALPGLSAKAGADVTVRNQFDSKFNAAPYINLQYRLLNNLMLMADAVGGVEEYDMRHIYAISPYWLDRRQIVDGYNKLDASLGVRWNTSDNLEISGRGGYRSVSGLVFQSSGLVEVIGTQLTQSDASLIYGELSGRVSLADSFNASATAGYYKWDSDAARLYMQMLPEMSLDLAANGRLTDKLVFNAKYSFVLLTEYAAGARLPNVNNLNVGLRYEAQDNLDILLDVKNLFNSRYYRYAGCRMQETAILASLLFRF